MEQQTISLAKAGIHATLNARASILAAANPQLGRYDKNRTLGFNVNISAPIMSRFDIFFIIFDEKNDDEDYQIAQHIVNMNRLKDDACTPDCKMEQVQTYRFIMMVLIVIYLNKVQVILIYKPQTVVEFF